METLAISPTLPPPARYVSRVVLALACANSPRFQPGNDCGKSGYGRENGVRTSRVTKSNIRAAGATKGREFTDSAGRRVTEHTTNDGRVFHEVVHASGRKSFHAIHGPSKAKPKPAAKAAAGKGGGDAAAPATFAARVQAAADAVAAREGPGGNGVSNLGDKVHIAAVHAEYERRHGPIPLDEFKRRLTAEGGAGDAAAVSLAREDNPAQYDEGYRASLSRSEAKAGPSSYHYVRATPKAFQADPEAVRRSADELKARGAADTLKTLRANRDDVARRLAAATDDATRAKLKDRLAGWDDRIRAAEGGGTTPPAAAKAPPGEFARYRLPDGSDVRVGNSGRIVAGDAKNAGLMGKRPADVGAVPEADYAKAKAAAAPATPAQDKLTANIKAKAEAKERLKKHGMGEYSIAQLTHVTGPNDYSNPAAKQAARDYLSLHAQTKDLSDAAHRERVAVGPPAPRSYVGPGGRHELDPARQRAAVASAHPRPPSRQALARATARQGEGPAAKAAALHTPGPRPGAAAASAGRVRAATEAVREHMAKLGTPERGTAAEIEKTVAKVKALPKDEANAVLAAVGLHAKAPGAAEAARRLRSVMMMQAEGAARVRTMAKQREDEPVQGFPAEPGDRASNAPGPRAAGLPALSGSEKQVRWAEQIRAKLIPRAEQHVAELERAAASPRADDDDRKDLARARAKLEKLKATHQSRFWIDSRDSSAHSLLLSAGAVVPAAAPRSRVALAQSARPAAVVLSLSAADQRAAPGAVIDPPPGMPARKGSQPLHYRRYRIAKARPFYHLGTGAKEEITRDRIALWASAFDDYAKDGTYPFIYPRHLNEGEQPDASKTLGYVVGVQLDGDDWYSVEQYIGDDAARVADANGRSITIHSNGVSTDGKRRHPEYMPYLALTPRSALPEAGYVPTLAASGAVVMAPHYVCDAGGCRPRASRRALALSAAGGNCGDGAGGFREGNACGKGGGGGTVAAVETRHPDHVDPPSRAFAAKIGRAVRKEIKSCHGTTRNQCANASRLIAGAFPNAEVYDGTIPGEWEESGAHTVAKLGKYFIDATADQFGKPKVFVFTERDRREGGIAEDYADFTRDRGTEKARKPDGPKETRIRERVKAALGRRAARTDGKRRHPEYASRRALALSASDGGCSKWREIEGEPVCLDGSQNPNRLPAGFKSTAGTGGTAPAVGTRPMTEADHATAREHARQARNAQRQADKYRAASTGGDYYERQAAEKDKEAAGHRAALAEHVRGIHPDEARPYTEAAHDVDKPLPEKRESPAAAESSATVAPSHEYHHDATGLTFARSGDTVTVTGKGVGRYAAALERAGFKEVEEDDGGLDVGVSRVTAKAPARWEGPADAVGALAVPRAWDIPAKLGLRFKGKVGGGRQLTGR